MRRTLAIALAALLAVGPGAWAMPSRTLDDYVLLGFERVTLKDGVTVAGGDVGVNQPAGLAFSAGRTGRFLNGTTVVADSVRGDRLVMDDLYTNRLLSPAGGITITGTGPQPTGALPLIDPLPALPAFTPGSHGLVVSSDLTIPPGNYGNLVVRTGATLTLTAGTYQIGALSTGRNVRIVATGPVTINVKGNLKIGNYSFMGVEPPLMPADMQVNIGGTTGRFGSNTTAIMMLYGPRARLAFGRTFVGTGQFVGKVINTDHSTTFSRGECGNGILETGEQCDPPDGVACDATCQLVVQPTTTSSSTTTTTTTTTTTSTSSTSSSSTSTTSTSSSSSTTSSSTSTSSSAPTTTSSSTSTSTTSSSTSSTSTSSSTTSTEPTTTTSSSSTSTSTSTSTSSTSTSTTSSSTSSTSTSSTSSSSTTSTEPTTTTSTSSTSTSSTSTTTTTEPPATSTSSSTTSTSSSTSSTSPTPTSTPPPTSTTTSTLPPAICGNNELEEGEECDPPGSACPPDGVCLDHCVCLFGGSS